MSDTKISKAVAWQYREDARHNGFDDDAWFDCTRELFNTLSAIIGTRQFASVARGDGAWREDQAGWPTQVRALYDHPQPADLAEQQGVREKFEAWAAENQLNLARYVDMGDVFCDERTKTAFAAWQSALAATGEQQVGEVHGDVPDPAVIVPTLRAMVRNYSDGHRWDHLDARMCQAAAGRIETLEDALAARQPGAQEPVDFYVCDTCGHYYMENGVTCDCTALAKQPPLRHVRMVAAPPAQGIDLGKFRRPILEWQADMQEWVDENGDHGGVFARDIAEADRLLALIGQRDAATGVGNG